jgi:diguanylate cyclase (GGDEF)-like protein
MTRALARQQELTRRAAAMNSAARALTSVLDPDVVVSTAVELAAELLSPIKDAPTRAQYYRIAGGQVSFVHVVDENEFRAESFLLAEHPYLSKVVATMSPTYGTLSPEDAGPNVRLMMQRAKVVSGAWVPVVVDGELDGVLAMYSRCHDLGEDEFEQLQAVGGLLELSLGIARSHELLQMQAMTDGLTGLANRRAFEQLLDHRPGRHPFAVLAIDVDELKLLNDRAGHAAGDELLRAIGQVLAGAMRRGDVLARTGGDEFAAFCFDANTVAATEISARIFRALANVRVAGLPARISVGAACGDSMTDARSVYEQADAAMYEAKRAGGMRLVSSHADSVGTGGCTVGRATAVLTRRDVH